MREGRHPRRLLLLLPTIAASAVILTLSGSGSAAWAAEVDNEISASQEKTRLSQASQNRIDQINNEIQKRLADYRGVIKEIDGLKVYNQQMEKQISNQGLEMRDLSESIDNVTVIERQITPLMLRMIDALKQFVELDVPFLLEERQDRVTNLEELMDVSDVAVSEKFRSVIEAYQTENEYGRTIETYKGELTIEGEVREVEFLKIGRVGLYYQTMDGEHSGIYEQASGDFVALSDKYRSQILQGLRIAKKQAAPDLLRLPVPAAEAGQ